MSARGRTGTRRTGRHKSGSSTPGRPALHVPAGARAGGGTATHMVATFHDMPRHWIWMQVVIILCIIASIVIAITKLT